MSRPVAVVFPDNLAALAICRELGCLGIPSIVLSGNQRGPAAHCRFARFARSPDIYHQPEGWVEFAIALANHVGDQPVLFPTEDAALLVAEKHYEKLSPSFRYSYSAPGAASRILDKSSLYALAGEAAVAIPEYHVVNSVSAVPQDDRQWIVKPFCRYRLEGNRIYSFLQLSGGLKALSGNARQAVAQVLAAGFPALIQEALPGKPEDLVSVGLCLSPAGEVATSFTARKLCEYPQPFGDGLVVEAIPDPGVTEAAARLLRKAGYWGMCDVEFKRDSRDGSFKLLDANPRAWLWMGLGAARGHYLAQAAYRCATGERSACAPAPERRLQRWVSARSVAAFMLRCYRPRRHGFELPVRLLVGSLRTAAFNWRMFHDPLYLKPSAWIAVAASLRKRREVNSSSRQFPFARSLRAGGAARAGGGK